MQHVSNSYIDPICCACQENIGLMPLDIYLKAVELRGEYLYCPDCRKHKCDCCGWLIPSQAMKEVKDGLARFIGNACESCWTWVIDDMPTKQDFPHFLQTAKPNLEFLQFNSVASENEQRWKVR